MKRSKLILSLLLLGSSVPSNCCILKLLCGCRYHGMNMQEVIERLDKIDREVSDRSHPSQSIPGKLINGIYNNIKGKFTVFYIGEVYKYIKKYLKKQ